jgi:hypothetical protein
MNHELPTPVPRRPYEVFNITEEESLNSRISHEHFMEIMGNERTLIHRLEDQSNEFGEFLFVTLSRAEERSRVFMTFYGLGYHEYRERWLKDEWFWYQAQASSTLNLQGLPKEEAEQIIQARYQSVQAEAQKNTQSRRGQFYEMLADLTDDDGALAEMEDLESFTGWLFEVDQLIPPEEPPTGEYLLDQASREKLPQLYSGEELGLEAQAQVKFFTLDSNWTWYASEFDGEDLLFGLVIGHEIELGYFSLSELQGVAGPLGLPIERDLGFKPKKSSCNRSSGDAGKWQIVNHSLDLSWGKLMGEVN